MQIPADQRRFQKHRREIVNLAEPPEVARVQRQEHDAMFDVLKRFVAVLVRIMPGHVEATTMRPAGLALSRI